MKVIVLFLFLSGFFLFSCKEGDEIVFKDECYPEALKNGVIASYSFKAGSLDDETSTGADLVNVNNAQPTTDRMGNPNCAFTFDQSQGEQYLTTASTSFLDGLERFSISVWYHPLDTVRMGGRYEVLVGRNSLDNQFRCPDRIGEWSLGLYDCRRAVFGHNNSVWSTQPDFPVISCEEYIKSVTDVWIHVVAVYTTDSYKIYQNGLLQESVSGVAACSNPYLAQDFGDLFLGKNYTGKIDDILIYNREISDAEVSALYLNQACCQP